MYTFILNPAARNGSAAGRRRAVEAALAGTGIRYRVRLTGGPGHAVELACAAAPESDAVVAVGGDGTVQEVARGLLRSGLRVPLGVIPMGTGNDFAKMLRMPADLARAGAALAAARPAAADYGIVRWEENGAVREHIFVNAVGVGFDAYVAGVVPRFKALPGMTGYIAAALHALRRWRFPGAAIEGGDRDGGRIRFDGPLLFLTAANGVCSGGGFYLTPGASIQDGLLDVCLIRGLPVYRVLQLLPLALRGRHVGAPEVQIRRVEAITVTAPTPLPVHADGEVVTPGAGRIDIRIVAGGLTVLAAPGGPR